MAEKVERLVAELRGTLERLEHAAGATVKAEPPRRSIRRAGNECYQEFEEIFRGSREEIMRRQKRYLGYFLGCRRVVDLGCGRGEFLQLCREAGIGALGVDIDAEMVRTCRQMGIEAVESDLIAFLEEQPDGSLDGIFSAQVIEHLETEVLLELLRLAYRKLAPRSYLILETLNVDNLLVGASRFYADITHVRPIPASTLEFLARSHGFDDSFILYGSPPPEGSRLEPIPIEPSDSGLERWTRERINQNFEKLNQLLFTYQDYALVARRPADATLDAPGEMDSAAEQEERE